MKVWNVSYSVGRFIALVLLLCLSGAVRAQTSRLGGARSGSIVDGTGALVAGATVTVRSPATGQSRTSASDTNGRFQVRELPAGIYTLSVKHEGFASYENSGIAISLGSVATITVELSPASIAQQVTVTGQPNALDSTQTAIATT